MRTCTPPQRKSPTRSASATAGRFSVIPGTLCHLLWTDEQRMSRTMKLKKGISDWVDRYDWDDLKQVRVSGWVQHSMAVH
jgi:hypothetical protein